MASLITREQLLRFGAEHILLAVDSAPCPRRSQPLSKKESQLTNGTFADYFLPAAADLPDIVVEHVETPWPHTSLGAKGAGEVVTTGAVGAIMNAVNDAVRLLGACINEGLMTPLRILKALRRL